MAGALAMDVRVLPASMIRLLITTPPPEAYRPDGWVCLRGGRLEYSDTGFFIELQGNPRKATYHGFDPEGRLIVWGNMLQPLKQYIEQAAADRKEIMP